MANGTDSEEFRLVSGARSGLKREFAFAVRNQSDYSASIGRTRGKKVQNIPFADDVSDNRSLKRFKSNDAKEDSEIHRIDKKTVEIDFVFESKGDEVKSTCMEELKLDLVKSPVVDEPNMKLGESVIADEPESNLADGGKGLREEEGTAEVPIVINANVEGHNALLEKSSRRFTRSSLKPEAEPIEISAIATSSGSTVMSEEACNDGKMSDAISPLKRSRLEIKMSKQIALNKVPVNVKDLLETGLLEGMHVRYLFRNKKTRGIKGRITDGGILCFCATCKGRQVVTAYNFEKHAGSTNKHPSNHIYLENGNNLREVLNSCTNARLEIADEIIKSAISSPEKHFNICRNCKEPLSSSRTTKTGPFCESCVSSDESIASPSSLGFSSARLAKSVSTPKSSGSVSALVLSQAQKKGKLTRKDLNLHKLVFAEDGLPDGTELAYYVRGEKKLEGYKKGLSIYCRHCESEVSASQFEAHAGYASRRKPYLNIYTSNGVSLHELSISLSKDRKLSNTDNDDLCGYCAEFGDLLCCDMCPRAFHQVCVGLSSIPSGKWYCPYCITMYEREKSCEYNANAMAAGRVSGVDPIEQITRRCIRIVETTETEVGGCVLCRRHGFSKSGFNPSTVILCDQCEKEYHVGCLRDHKMADLKELPKGKWFCCVECEYIHTALQKLVARGSEKLPDSLLKVIKKKQEAKYPNDGGDFDVRWRVLSGKMATPESKSLLFKAVTIFHDQFDPIVDAKSGRDFIPSMVYGKSIGDQEFGGMYCTVLTVNSTVVSAGILRILGQDTAEIPLVATTSDNQGRGYFQSLFSCIERLLGFLSVKTIILPSAEESKSIWTDKFGFSMVSPDKLSEYKNNGQMMTFQGTSMLQKLVPKCRIVDKSPGRS